MPSIIPQQYASAKAAFDRKDYVEAAAGFSHVLTVLADPDVIQVAGRPPLSWVGPLLVFVFVVGAWAMPSGAFFYLAGPVIVASMLLLLLSHFQTNAFERWGITTAACLYTSFLASYLILLRDAPNGLYWMGAALIGTWLFDSGAYLIGSR